MHTLSPPQIGVAGPPDPVKSPRAAYAYLDARRRVIDEEARARPLVRLWDKNMHYIGTIAAEVSVDAEELLHDTGQADVVLRGDDWIVEFLRADIRKDEDLHITIDPFPNRRNWRWRWGGKVVNVRVKRDENGTRTVTFECAHNREHWKHLYFGATPFMDPSVQPIKAWLLPGNVRTIVATTAFINLARNYWPGLALPANALNPFAWVGEASNVFNLNPLNWPVQVQFVNPLFDQSRFSVIMSRWSDAHSVTHAILKDSGCHLRAYTWLPEDEDSPHPELAAIVGERAARPTRACVVLAVEDKSGRTGPTGTAWDGILNLIGVVGDNFVTETVYEVIGTNKAIDPRTNSPAPPIISSLIGVAPELPTIAFRDHEHSAIISSEHSMFRSKAIKILTGGKSPGWVNQTQTFLIKYALSQLSYVIQTAVGPEVTGVQNPGTPGLEELYQGQLDNTLLAFIQVTDPVRAATAGPYAFLEHFEQGSGSAYTVSSALTLREGHYKTRPYQAFQVSIRNGRPHTLFYDFDLGDRALFEIDGVLYTDQVTAVRMRYDTTTPKTFELSIGDDTESESPTAQVMRIAQAFWSALAMLFGSGDMF